MKVYEAFIYDPAHPENFPWHLCLDNKMETLGMLISNDIKKSKKTVEADALRDALAYIAGLAVIPDAIEIEVPK